MVYKYFYFITQKHLKIIASKPWDKAIYRQFDANQARLKMECLVFNLFHLLRGFCMKDEKVK